MGWWSQDEQGHSFAQAEGEDMVWGDEPADILDNALDAIAVSFQAEYGRRPTRHELLAGMKFSLGGGRYEE